MGHKLSDEEVSDLMEVSLLTFDCPPRTAQAYHPLLEATTQCLNPSHSEITHKLCDAGD